MWLKRILKIIVCIVLIVPAGFRINAYFTEDLEIGEALPKEGRLVKTSFGDIFVLEEGRNTDVPLLFAHGTAAWSKLWHPTLIKVSKHNNRAIAFDMPPFGYSERDKNDDYSRKTQAAKIIELVKSLNIKPIMIAHSFGAGPSVEAVMIAPEMFSGLILVDGAVGLNSHKDRADLPFYLADQTTRELLTSMSATNPLLTKTFLKTLLYKKEAASDDIVAILQRPASRKLTTRAFATWLPYLLQAPEHALSTREEEYKKLPTPTVIIWGDKDNVTPLSQGEALNQLIPNSKLLTLPDVGHIPQIEAPEQFQKILIEAIETIKKQL